MMDCWSQHPSRRPSFRSIRESLEELMNDSSKTAYIDVTTFEVDDLAPYQTMAPARINSSRTEEESFQEGRGGGADGGVAYFNRLQAENESDTGNPYFDHLPSKTDKASGNGNPYFDHLPSKTDKASGNGNPYFDHLPSKTDKASGNGNPYFDHLQQGSGSSSQTPMAENRNENQYFDQLAGEQSGNGTGRNSYFDSLTAGNDGSGNDSHTGNGNRSLTVAIAGRTLSSLSQNAPLSPSSQVAVGGRSSHHSHRDDDEISICSQHIEEMDTAM